MFQKKATRTVAASMGLALVLTASQIAGANDFNSSNTYGDEYGNVIQHEAGGPKIIFVGSSAAKSDGLGRDIRRQVPVYKRAKGPSVIYPVSDPVVVGVVPAPNTGCDSPFVIRGRSYMYGLDRNETPVIGHPGCD
ncbi:hypothetical protein [Phyllobacterium zundukense]|uniref:Uncharacterized protein n=1 Tax=Phyllobacterium zundukense TaxID=1867719 RepID=A0A2N9VWS3_9HYPH|nr:hypothetical protein [Phyllobacterium zundukense]ATU93516.1 hypothetical protein BLM14_19305 [Phyllobacterium zundukense]PIO43941.1 hypothetical protein B5P45_15300 [Phyllobacterium zundukense]